MKLNERLAYYRKINDLKQIDVASALGVSSYIISDYEKGRSEPSISRLIKLARIYNVSIDALVGYVPGGLSEYSEKYDELLQAINSYPEEEKVSAIERAVDAIRK